MDADITGRTSGMMGVDQKPSGGGKIQRSSPRREAHVLALISTGRAAIWAGPIIMKVIGQL